MNHAASPTAAPHIFRVDTFTVPPAAREEFLARVQDTHALLRTQPGFVHDWILEQTDGPARFNLVTTVEWVSEAAIERAKTAVAEMHRQAGVNVSELVSRLGISVDRGTYAATATAVDRTAAPVRETYRPRWLRA